MNHDDARFDMAMRALHAQAVDRISPQVRQRLRTARTPPVRAPRALGWGLASGCAALFGLVVALQFRMPHDATPEPGVAAPVAVASTAPPDVPVALAALEQNPDFYLWLASNESALPTSLE